MARKKGSKDKKKRRRRFDVETATVPVYLGLGGTSLYLSKALENKQANYEKQLLNTNDPKKVRWLVNRIEGIKEPIKLNKVAGVLGLGLGTGILARKIISNKRKNDNFNLCSIGLIEFAQKEEKKETNKARTAITSLALLEGGQKALRRGIPMSLGVRLESHSTGKEKARKILAGGGLLDPNRMGETTGKAMGSSKNAIYPKNYSFITGRHPDFKPIPGVPQTDIPAFDRLMAGSVRKAFRLQGTLTTEEMNILARENLRQKTALIYNSRNNLDEVTKDKLVKQYRELFDLDIESLDELMNKGSLNKIKGTSVGESSKLLKTAEKVRERSLASGLYGKSLYVGGSDDFFRQNFTDDVDMPGFAMKTDKPLKVYGNRASATIGAIRREGLGNLLKNKKRVGRGLALTTLGTAATVQGVKGLSKVFVKGHKREDGTKVKGFWRNLR